MPRLTTGPWSGDSEIRASASTIWASKRSQVARFRSRYQTTASRISRSAKGERATNRSRTSALHENEAARFLPGNGMNTACLDVVEASSSLLEPGALDLFRWLVAHRVEQLFGKDAALALR